MTTTSTRSRSFCKRARERARKYRDIHRCRHRAGVHQSRARVDLGRDPPPLFIATIWFRSASTRRTKRARADRAVNANLQEGLSGVRYRRRSCGGQEPRGLYRHRLRLSRCARARQRLVGSTSRSSTSSPTSRRASYSERQRARRARRAPSRLADCVPPVPQPLLRTIQQLSQVFDSYQQARVAIDRITELLATPTTVPQPLEPVFPSVCGAKSCSTTCTSSTRPLSTKRCVASICGSRRARPSRSSVSRRRQEHGHEAGITLLRRHRREVRVDGVPVDDYDRSRSTSSSASFPGSLPVLGDDPRQHRVRREDATTPRSKRPRARSAPRLHRVAPRGYLQWVSERGRSLSSGQRQLIALARATSWIRILLLDEATPPRPPDEAKVQAAMGVAAQGRTTI